MKLTANEIINAAELTGTLAALDDLASVVFNEIIDVAVDWIDEWIVTPVLGHAPQSHRDLCRKGGAQ